MPVGKLTAKDRERFARARAPGAARATDPSAIVDARYDAARGALDLETARGLERPWQHVEAKMAGEMEHPVQLVGLGLAFRHSNLVAERLNTTLSG